MHSTLLTHPNGIQEFEYYYNNRSNSFVKNGSLYLQPTLTNDRMDITNSDLDLWGGAPADLCTSNAFFGCQRTGGAGGNVLNPVQSARLRTAETFDFRYGKVEVRAKLPRGDWLWPAIWALPANEDYGAWPASGEIDIMESRGNAPGYAGGGGADTFGSTLHWGPHFGADQFNSTHKVATTTPGAPDLSQAYHTFGLIWTADRISTYLDDPTNVVLDVPVPKAGFWKEAGLDKSGFDNPWVSGGKDAPFDQKFYLVLNVACGGTNGYFPDGVGDKPWKDSSSTASTDFWNSKEEWFPTWKGDAAAMQVDYVRVWQQKS
jgi:beta-glucanase (GH16 family)